MSEVSERAALLVREEIALAKAEVTEKATKLLKGGIVAAAAGIFAVIALLFFLEGMAWLFYYLLPVDSNEFYYGFFTMAGVLLLMGALAGLIAYRAIKAGSPPTPAMAIDEARKIRQTVGAGGGVPEAGGGVVGAGGGVVGMGGETIDSGDETAGSGGETAGSGGDTPGSGGKAPH